MVSMNGMSKWDRFRQSRKRLVSESIADRVNRCVPCATANDAALKVFNELRRVRLRNTVWFTAESRSYWTELTRWYRHAVSNDPGVMGLTALATCYYQTSFYDLWEYLLHHQRLLSARDIEKSLRWNGRAYSNQGDGHDLVQKFLATHPQPNVEKRNLDLSN